jgi:hypothetical protein
LNARSRFIMFQPIFESNPCTIPSISKAHEFTI